MGSLSVSNQRNSSQGCRISLPGSVSGDFRVEGAGDGFLECTHLHSSLSLAEQREEVGEMRGRLLSCELHLPGVRGSIVNSDLVPSTVHIYYPSHLTYTSINRGKGYSFASSSQKVVEMYDKVAQMHNCHVENVWNFDKSKIKFIKKNSGSVQKHVDTSQSQHITCWSRTIVFFL